MWLLRFFPYRAKIAHCLVEDEIAEEVESISLILLLAKSYILHIKTCHMVCQLVCKISKYSFASIYELSINNSK